MPDDPFLEQNFDKSPVMEQMLARGISTVIIEAFRELDYAVEADMLAAICAREQSLGTPRSQIDSYAIAFAEEYNLEIYNDALVVLAHSYLGPESTL